MKIERANTHIFEVEQLACAMTGLDYDEIDADSEIIEQKIFDTFGTSLDQFQDIVNRLLPLIMIANSPLSEVKYKGFANIEAGVWYVKTEL